MKTSAQKHRLPYFANSAALFAQIADEPWAIFLDSGAPFCEQGRYDIMAYAPVTTLLNYGNNTRISNQDGVYNSTDDPFALVNKYLQPPMQGLDGLPFNGGAMGYFAYDLARRIEALPSIAEGYEGYPQMAVGIYTWAVVVDHQLRESWLVAEKGHNCERLLSKFSAIAAVKPAEFAVLSAAQSNMDAAYYQNAFAKIKNYLSAGDCYQVNLAQRFSSAYRGDPWQLYVALREVNPSPFGAYLNFAGMQILSSSPEQFLQLRGDKVQSKPIKGTRPRLGSPRPDQLQIQQLSSSKKDRAENLMIVDLLRNDLGKSCQKGTVKVSKLFAVESFATVHHLVSTVTATLAKDANAIQLLRGCFPGGSITGAPKIRAMQIIEDLEPNRRGIYCGSIAYIGFDGNMDSNIAIRTMVCHNNEIRFWAGGGIVYDSIVAAEYQESFDKAAVFLSLLEQFATG